MKQFLEGDPARDETLKAYIRDDEKCDEAILAWAIEGLKRLLKNKGCFTFTKSMEETRKQYERSTNPTAAFVQDNCHQDCDKHIEKDHLYRCLKKYCEQFKLPTPNASTFGQKLKEMTDWVITVEGIYDPEKKTKFSYWRGIAFNDDSPFSNIASQSVDNSIPLLNEEKNILKNKNENFRTQGLDEKVRTGWEDQQTKTETKPEASILPTNPYAGNMPRKLRKLCSKNSVIKTLDAFS